MEVDQAGFVVHLSHLGKAKLEKPGARLLEHRPLPSSLLNRGVGGDPQLPGIQATIGAVEVEVVEGGWRRVVELDLKLDSCCLAFLGGHGQSCRPARLLEVVEHLNQGCQLVRHFVFRI